MLAKAPSLALPDDIVMRCEDRVQGAYRSLDGCGGGTPDGGG
jgi:hypothetical protein